MQGIKRYSVPLSAYPIFMRISFKLENQSEGKVAHEKKKKNHLNSACPGQERGLLRINFSSLAAFLLSPE